MSIEFLEMKIASCTFTGTTAKRTQDISMPTVAADTVQLPPIPFGVFERNWAIEALYFCDDTEDNAWIKRHTRSTADMVLQERVMMLCITLSAILRAIGEQNDKHMNSCFETEFKVHVSVMCLRALFQLRFECYVYLLSQKIYRAHLLNERFSRHLSHRANLELHREVKTLSGVHAR